MVKEKLFVGNRNYDIGNDFSENTTHQIRLWNNKGICAKCSPELKEKQRKKNEYKKKSEPMKRTRDSFENDPFFVFVRVKWL